jgi:hypothetical protein
VAPQSTPGPSVGHCALESTSTVAAAYPLGLPMRLFTSLSAVSGIVSVTSGIVARIDSAAFCAVGVIATAGAG